MSLENVGMQHSLAVMFRDFPVEKRSNAAINTMLILYTSLREVGPNGIRQCGDAILTSCYVPCAAVKRQKNGCHYHGSLILHTPLGHMVRVHETDHLRWEEGEKSYK